MVSIDVSAADVASFRERGFVIKQRVLDPQFVSALQASFPRLFAGEFDTGSYPDEWYWRENMSLPDVTRHMGNAWKSDLTVARLVLSEEIARAAAALAGWNGVKLGQDTLWWKPPQAKSVSFHQDTSFMSFLDPCRTMTCWVALDDTHRDAGTLEYVPGSHLWPVTPIPSEFHARDDYRAPMRAAASSAGLTDPEPVFVEVPAGSVAFHAGEMWHGSGVNRSSDRMRRSIGIHLLDPNVRFSDRKGGYIYRRYQLTGSPELNESFFPLLWRADGHRTEWIARYLESGLR
ncbi:MAG: phytanoyl-CoA dioxygenase family protein [Bryobacterales bacterium]|nr:phytanoyl-CoA dioxygenase family protein [Bryobacterales bacterium]